MRFLIVLLLLIVAACCPKDGRNGLAGKDGQDGAPGTPGSSCSVEQVSNGAIILCENGTNAVILNGTNGQDGQNAPPTAYTVTEIVNPCGDGPGFDEILLRLANGQLIAHFSGHGNDEFLAVLSAGSYVTTDQQACHFNVDVNGNVTY